MHSALCRRPKGVGVSYEIQLPITGFGIRLRRTLKLTKQRSLAKIQCYKLYGDRSQPSPLLTNQFSTIKLLKSSKSETLLVTKIKLLL